MSDDRIASLERRVDGLEAAVGELRASMARLELALLAVALITSGTPRELVSVRYRDALDEVACRAIAS